MSLFKKKEQKIPHDKILEVVVPQPPAAMKQQEPLPEFTNEPQPPQQQPQQRVTLEEIAEVLDFIYNDIKNDMALLAQNQLLWNQNMLNLTTELQRLQEKSKPKK